MTGQQPGEVPGTVAQSLFATTHWSVVLAAADGQNPEGFAALEQLCGFYWQPLYVYIRRRGYGPEAAQDLTQQFLLELVRKRTLGAADPTRGRFRTFLLNSLQHFLTDEWRRAHRVKRGGGALAISLDELEAAERYCREIAETMTPERAYERRWAISLLEKVLGTLRHEYAQAGKAHVFTALQDFLWGAGEPPSYAQIARELDVKEGSARVAVHRLREQYRARLRAEIAQTVATPAEVEEELRYLIEVMS